MRRSADDQPRLAPRLWRACATPRERDAATGHRREMVRPDAIRFNRWLTRWA
jgi:hypothetical protein